MERNIIVYKQHFIEFYSKLDNKTQLKVEYVLDLIRFEKRVPNKFFKHLSSTDGIYEIRIVTTFKSIRILCFLEEEDLVILVNCFFEKDAKNTKK